VWKGSNPTPLDASSKVNVLGTGILRATRANGWRIWSQVACRNTYDRYAIPGVQLVGDLRVESEAKGVAILRAMDWLKELERPTKSVRAFNYWQA